MVLRKNIYKGVYLQRGSGIGTVLSGLFRILVPFLRRGASAALRSQPVKRLGRKAGKAALKAASNIAKDIVAGKASKKSTKINLKQAQHGIERAIQGTVFDSDSIAKKAAKKRIGASGHPVRPKKKKVLQHLV